MTPLEALETIKHTTDLYISNDLNGYKQELDTIETALKALETIEENLQFGYVFIGYDKDNKLWFQFADAELYEEIKKKRNCYE